MLSEHWQEVFTALNKSVPIFLLGMIALAVLLLLVFFARAGARQRLRVRSQKTVEQENARARRLSGQSVDLGPGGVSVLQPLHAWMRQRDRLPIYLSAGVLLTLGVGAMLTQAGLAPALAFMLAAFPSIALPLGLWMRKRRRWLEGFEAEFPNAMETIVRGLRSGLPLNDCILLVAREAGPQISSAFRLVLDDIEIGVPLEQALQRLAKRAPLDEVRFFAVVVGLQSQTGGQLADMLQTLANTLRTRRDLAVKIDIMSQEARASAMIIGSLPVLVGALLFFVSPDYIGTLFSTTGGLVALGISGLWMLLGIQVMRSMISFDA